MKIAIDVRPLYYSGTGNAVYLYNILKEVLKLSSNWKWYLITNKTISEEYEDLLSFSNIHLIKQNSLFAKASPLWFHSVFPNILKANQIDIFWSSLFLLPYNMKKRYPIPTLLNIHDLNAWIAPETMVYWKQLYLKTFTRNSLLHSDVVMCLSHTTKNLIQKIFPTESKKTKLIVVYPGLIAPPKDTKKPKELNFDKFLLSVGTLEPRKNFETLIQGYLLAKEENKNLLPLVIAGKKGWNLSPILTQLVKNEFKEKDIYFVNSPKKEELFWLYENCSLFLFPSIYEGFGLPILEAAYYKKPQILSKIEIFEEIGKNFDGIFFVKEVKNPQHWKNAILQFFSQKTPSILNTQLSLFDYTNSAKIVIETINQFVK
ncbi:MAG: glycosyltransferase family 4 protein [Leptospiraceae bacterium]|nr:glycosyltransferase family 4 protein [Leptospiraceae bacterium]MDW7976613.1 glycosyltransferase family 1 protein [Leptospiraceae bacterium]